MNNELIVFQFGDSEIDWVIAHSKEEAVSFYAGHCNIDVEDANDAFIKEMSHEDLASLTMCDGNGNETGETFADCYSTWGDRDELVPFIFATTEY